MAAGAAPELATVHLTLSRSRVFRAFCSVCLPIDLTEPRRTAGRTHGCSSACGRQNFSAVGPALSIELRPFRQNSSIHGSKDCPRPGMSSGAEWSVGIIEDGMSIPNWLYSAPLRKSGTLDVTQHSGALPTPATESSMQVTWTVFESGSVHGASWGIVRIDEATATHVHDARTTSIIPSG